MSPNASGSAASNFGPTSRLNQFSDGVHDRTNSAKRQKPSCFGVRQSYTPGKPDPWVMRKFFVGVGLALVVWTCYVFVGRACTPIIQQKSASGMTRGVGIGVLVGFIIMFILVVWSYGKIITAEPGFARKVVPKSPPPFARQELPMASAPLQPSDPQASRIEDSSAPDPSTLAPIGNLVSETVNRALSPGESSLATLSQDPPLKNNSGRHKTDWRDVQRPVPKIDHGPRWCRFCEINKPDRTHHCRHCGTCILQFDHHCIWLGQCVGWQNHKFFMTFTFWGMCYCFYMLIFSVILVTKDPSPDGQVIGLIAVAALFGLFTFAMWTTHVHLIITGRSTVESFQGRDQEEQETSRLQQEFGYFWHNQDKRKVKKRWKEEWGGVPVDARWKWGSALDLWREEMGADWVGWLLPIGKPRGDGIHFKSNPRFGPNGEWLQKKDWPAELQV